MKFDEAWLTECANDLIARSGASLVVAGAQQPVVVQLMVYGINAALKNVGATVIVRQFARNPKTQSILQLSADIAAGRIKQLFIFGGDPVYNAPRALTPDPVSKQSFDWSDLQKRVPDVVRLGLLRRRDLGHQQMACADGALSRIVGRRAHLGRKLTSRCSR